METCKTRTIVRAVLKKQEASPDLLQIGRGAVTSDCLDNMMLYTDRFMLDEESGRWWRLRDPDMAAAGALAAPDIIDYLREF